MEHPTPRLSVAIAPMGPRHARQVLAIHQAGIDEGNATFEIAARVVRRPSSSGFFNPLTQSVAVRLELDHLGS